MVKKRKYRKFGPMPKDCLTDDIIWYGEGGKVVKIEKAKKNTKTTTTDGRKFR